jgi:hypothetical protein
MSRAAVLLAVLIAAPFARADVIVVDAGGGGDVTTLTDAVAAALNGDTILVRPGSYNEPGTVIVDGKGLTIVGERPTPPSGPDVTVRPGFLLRNLPAAHNVVIANLLVIGESSVPGFEVTPALVLSDNVSHVRVQDCDLVGGDAAGEGLPNGAPGVDAVNSGSVALVDVSVRGGAGLYSPDQGVIAGPGGAGINWLGGQLLVYQSIVSGGDGGGGGIGASPNGGNGGTGLQHASGTLLVVGSSIGGGDGGTAHFGGAGGTALAMGGSLGAWLLGGSSLTGGAGGFSDVGPSGPAGAKLDDPLHVVKDFGGIKRRFDISSPLREGEQGVLDLGGLTNDVALVFLSPLLHQLPFPGHQGVLMLFPGTMIGPFTLGPPGTLDVPFTVPPLGPSIEALSVHVQAAYLGVGGGTSLGPGRVLTLLDDGF